MFGSNDQKKPRQNPIDTLLSRELHALDVMLKPWKKDDDTLQDNPVEVTADGSLKVDIKNFTEIQETAATSFSESLDHIIMIPAWVELYNFFKEIQRMRLRSDFIENDVIKHLISKHPEALKTEKSTVLKLQKLLAQEVADKGIEMTSVVTKAPTRKRT